MSMASGKRAGSAQQQRGTGILPSEDADFPVGESPWVPALNATDGPLYLALAAAIEGAMASGELPPGTRLPPQRWLAGALGITAGTVNRGYAIARERGLVTGEVGRGTFIRDTGQPVATVVDLKAAKPSLSPASPVTASVSGPLPSPRDPIAQPVPGRLINLTCFRNPVSGLNDMLGAAMVEAAGRVAALPLHFYPPVAGSRSQRRSAATWVKGFGVEASAETVMVTTGAQHAIFLTLKALTSPGDTILAEAVAYSGVKTIAALLGLRLVGVPMDGQGIDPDAFERLAVETGARLAILQPSLHNPTVQQMPQDRRQQVAVVARKLSLTIVEDDTAAAALEERPLPIAGLVPERTVFINSPSKCISPALRFGVIAAPATLLDRIEDTAHLSDLSTPPFSGELLSVLVESNLADQCIAAYRGEMARRYAIAGAALGGLAYSGHPAAFHLWLSLPNHWEARDFAAAVRDGGVLVAPSDDFAIQPGSVAQAVRISVNGDATTAELTYAMDVIAGLARARRRTFMVV